MTKKTSFEIPADELSKFYKEPESQNSYIEKWRIRLMESSETKADKLKMTKILDQWQKQTKQ